MKNAKSSRFQLRTYLAYRTFLVVTCPKYTYLRNKYINKYYTNRPSMLKFVQLLNSTNVKTLNNLAIFCIKAFKLESTWDVKHIIYIWPCYVM